MNLAVFSKG